MSDQKDTSTQDGNKQTGDGTSGAGDGFKAITSQDDLNRIIDDRLKRERAKYADYDQLKSKAEQFDKASEASKSEQQKLEERLSKAEQSAAEARVEALRFRVATKHGISDEDAELFLTGSDEETLTKQAERLSERTDQRKKGNHVPREKGGTTTPADDPKRQFLQELNAG